MFIELLFPFQGFVPGIFGVSHGAIQFMAYEEMKNTYNQYRMVPIDTKLVSVIHIINNETN
jgi:solute carrier family 25 folate transporter 32